LHGGFSGIQGGPFFSMPATGTILALLYILYIRYHVLDVLDVTTTYVVLTIVLTVASFTTHDT